MTAPEIIAFAIALFVGIPAMLRNWTAVGLVASFVFLQLLWLSTRQPVALEVMLLCDFVVLTVIFLKGEPIERVPTRSLLDQARAVWFELSREDKIIAAIFVPCWISYAANIGPVLHFWIPWTLGLAQFFVAGAEALGSWRRGRASSKDWTNPADWFPRWAQADEC